MLFKNIFLSLVFLLLAELALANQTQDKDNSEEEPRMKNMYPSINEYNKDLFRVLLAKQKKRKASAPLDSRQQALLEKKSEEIKNLFKEYLDQQLGTGESLPHYKDENVN